MIEFAMMDDASRDRMGVEGRRKVEQQFSETIVIEKYMRQIEKLGGLAAK